MHKYLLLLLLVISSLVSARPVVMLTGYWAPTSEMIMRFSPDSSLNPGGWIGENWEGYGYDVYAFFPAFDTRTREFEVDYQNTWHDFWARTDEFHPEIIISFGATDGGPWEIEYRARNRSSWTADEIAPFYPTPNPPDSTIAAWSYRYNTLPMSYIQHAVDNQTSADAWIDTYGDPGDYLCNYIAYLGMWYHDQHVDESDEHWCRAAGFIHVNQDMPLSTATDAAEVTLRSTLEYYANIADLAGSVSSTEPLENCTITLQGEDDLSYETEISEDGAILLEDVLFGQYQVQVLSGRYGWYEGEFTFSSPGDSLFVELNEYHPLPALTHCAGPETEAYFDESNYVLIGAHFSPTTLMPYHELHLNTVQFTAPANSEDCTSVLFLYRRNPLDGNTIMIENLSLTDYQAGELVEVWLSEFVPLTTGLIQAGLTIVLAINNPEHIIGWTDNGTANPNGNLMRIGTSWVHADSAAGISGNWDLRLGFYADWPESASPDPQVVTDLQLGNHPNPFNPTTTIRFELPRPMPVNLTVFNVLGEHQANLLNGMQSAGLHQLTFDGSALPAGLYIYRLEAESGMKTGKMLLVK